MRAVLLVRVQLQHLDSACIPIYVSLSITTERWTAKRGLSHSVDRCFLKAVTRAIPPEAQERRAGSLLDARILCRCQRLHTAFS